MSAPGAITIIARYEPDESQMFQALMLVLCRATEEEGGRGMAFPSESCRPRPSRPKGGTENPRRVSGTFEENLLDDISPSRP